MSRQTMTPRSAPRKGGGTSGGDKVKLLLALGLFLVAGLVLAWYYGVLPGFGGTEKARPLTPQEQQQFQESQQQQQQQMLRKDVSVGSS